ncbi:MAG: hypothetical protein JWM88_1882 [Verrucomicrobia bacterium]|nr:hypothetical protein [Verrucomicrobiota bacterium]
MFFSSLKNSLAAVAVLVSVAVTTNAYASSFRHEALSFGDSAFASAAGLKSSELTFESQHLNYDTAAFSKQGLAMGRTISATIAPPPVTVPENTSTIALLAMSCLLGLFFKKR